MGESAKKGEGLNGGSLFRGGREHDCPLPDIGGCKIAVDDEWVCACGQGWRARSKNVSHPTTWWKRIAERGSR